MFEGNPQAPASGRETLVELVCNVVAPTVVLLFLSGADRLGPALGVVVALAFPLGHAAATVARTRTASPLTLIAVVGVLLTGGIALLELDVRWFALKEALVPALFGVGVTLSAGTRWSVLEVMLARVLHGERVREALDERGTTARFAARLAQSTRRVGALFLASSALTLVLARWMVTSPTGTEDFAAELGRYTAMSFPAVGLPTALGMALVLRALLAGLEEDTGREIDDLAA